MHSEITVKQLKEFLSKVRDDKEVVIDFANNYYDIISLHQENNSVVLQLRLCYNREVYDPDFDGPEKVGG